MLKRQFRPYRVNKEALCPICENRGSDILYTYEWGAERLNISEILECSSCRHMFIYPAPLATVGERVMVEEGAVDSLGRLKSIHERFVLQKEISYVKQYLSTSGKLLLLDIGCGTGWTTNVWQKHGFIAHGLEPSSVTAAIAKKQFNIPVFIGSIEDYNPTEQYDIVIMRHVVEHIGEPVAVLKKVKSLLKPDGILLIILPNINCIGRFLFNEYWEWVLPWHLHFYKPTTLVRLVEKAGYQKLRLYQMPSPLWYPESLRNFLGKESVLSKILNKTPKIVAMFLFTPILIIGMIFNLNDNLVILAQPKK